MFLNLERQTSNKIKVDIQDDKGAIILQKIINIFSQKDLTWFLKVYPKWNRTEANTNLTRICEEENGLYAVSDYDPPPYLTQSNREVTTGEAESTPDIPLTIRLREVAQLTKYSVEYTNESPDECLRDVLNNPKSGSLEPLIEWTDKNKLAVLDIDYHEIPYDERPGRTDIDAIISRIRPYPLCWHISHGMGAKLFYVQKPGFTAEELASVAGLRWTELDPRATFDVAKTSRHPLYPRSRDNKPAPCKDANDIVYLEGAGDVSQLRRILTSELDEADVEEFLSSRGWGIGQTLPHSSCPIDAGSSSDETKENVYVGDKGLFCHRCYGRGLGGHTPGFTSYASLIGSKHDNRLRTMVKNFCHLEHARVVLSNMYPRVPLQVLEKVYHVLLKIVHTPDDPRIFLAMKVGRGIIRIRGQWVSLDGENRLEKGLERFVSSLPATMIPTEDGFTLNVSAHVAFLNTFDISDYGYPEVSFLRGCKVYGHHLPYPHNEIVKVLVRKEFANHVPTYLLPSKRMPIADAWALLNNEFPGIDVNYVKLLIAAKGSSEGRLSQCPYLLINGPTASGKSTTVNIVAGICGDKASEPIWVPQIDRFRQSLMDAARVSGFVLVNEVFKNADRSRMSPTQALDPMLSLTEDSRSHAMYIGSVPFGRLPVFVLTDIDTPAEVERDAQLTRRFTFYKLQSSNKWDTTFIKKRIQPHEFRMISTDHNVAADTILSDVIDTYFKSPMSLAEIATSLQIQTLEQYTEEVDHTVDTLIKFYNLVVFAPPVYGKEATRYAADLGWKKIDRTMPTDLLDSWNDLCDGQTPELWLKSRAINSKDWQKIVGTEFPITCEIRPQKSSIIIRFRSNESTRKPMWINGQIKNY